VTVFEAVFLYISLEIYWEIYWDSPKVTANVKFDYRKDDNNIQVYMQYGHAVG